MRIRYTVKRINGDYGVLVSCEETDADENPVAMALLPPGVDEGDVVVWEDFTYSIE